MSGVAIFGSCTPLHHVCTPLPNVKLLPLSILNWSVMVHIVIMSYSACLLPFYRASADHLRAKASNEVGESDNQRGLSWRPNQIEPSILYVPYKSLQFNSMPDLSICFYTRSVVIVKLCQTVGTPSGTIHINDTSLQALESKPCHDPETLVLFVGLLGLRVRDCPEAMVTKFWTQTCFSVKPVRTCVREHHGRFDFFSGMSPLPRWWI